MLNEEKRIQGIHTQDTKIVDPDVFEHVYKQLLTVTYQHDQDNEPSFKSGWWDKEEGYKRKIREDAITSMGISTWEEHKNDSQYIVQKAGQAFGISIDETTSLQNLVSYENYSVVFELFLKYEKEAAVALYELFCGDDDKKSFDLMKKLLSHKKMNDPLSVIAYYFFIKNPKKYVPVRKKGTGERLQRLSLDAACVQECDWGGYNKYLQIVSDLYVLLQSYHPDEDFLDAQSFLWLLNNIDYETPEYEELTDPFETIEIVDLPGAKEGKKKIVYTTRYERDPKIRRTFLATRIKPYKCEVCGMDFERVYGEIGKDVIEVHHKKPLYIDGVEQEVYPTEEYLACLCANCHRIIHKYKGKIMSVEELKELVQARNYISEE